MYTLLHGKDKSPINLFLDNTSNVAFSLNILHELTCNEDGRVIHACCHRYPAQIWKEKLTGNTSCISFHDRFSDPLNWLSDSAHSPANEIPSELLFSLPDQSKDTLAKKNIVFIDDLLLFGRSYGFIDNRGQWNGFVRFLHGLSLNNDVFMFANPSLLSDANIRSLRHISAFSVDIEANLATNQSYSCKYVHRKSSGKVLSNNVAIKLDDRGKTSLLFEESVREFSDESKEVDPAANLTFNLRLTDDEKEARANTALPYILKDTSKSAYLDKSSSGDVIYTPDEADDFDDDDPDDDLDF